jgi:hypothetical protein
MFCGFTKSNPFVEFICVFDLYYCLLLNVLITFNLKKVNIIYVMCIYLSKLYLI